MSLSHGAIVGIIAVGTFLLRLSFIHLYGRMELPPHFERAMKYVPPAALAALVLPAVLYPDGTLHLSLGNHHLLAAVVAGVVAYETESFFATVGVGMVALWTLRFLL